MVHICAKKIKQLKKNIIIYGLIAGVVVAIPMLFVTNSIANDQGVVDFDKGMLIGYASMLIAFSLVFVGIRNYRDKYLGGTITFGKAFKTGFYIVLISSTIYVITWLIDFFFFIPDFTGKYAAHMLQELKASGATAAEIEIKSAEMTKFAVLYKNPFFNALMTYMEILPVGLIVTLISSLILKRKPQTTT